jgi:hypothetical protein
MVDALIILHLLAGDGCSVTHCCTPVIFPHAARQKRPPLS